MCSCQKIGYGSDTVKIHIVTGPKPGAPTSQVLWKKYCSMLFCGIFLGLHYFSFQASTEETIFPILKSKRNCPVANDWKSAKNFCTASFSSDGCMPFGPGALFKSNLRRINIMRRPGTDRNWHRRPFKKQACAHRTWAVKKSLEVVFQRRQRDPWVVSLLLLGLLHNWWCSKCFLGVWGWWGSVSLISKADRSSVVDQVNSTGSVVGDAV